MTSKLRGRETYILISRNVICKTYHISLFVMPNSFQLIVIV